MSTVQSLKFTVQCVFYGGLGLCYSIYYSQNLKIFRTGFLYVFLLSANTLAIARLFWLGIAVFGFLISFLWTVNVKRLTVSTLTNRFYYAFGAMLGGVAGVFVVNFFKNIINN